MRVLQAWQDRRTADRHQESCRGVWMPPLPFPSLSAWMVVVHVTHACGIRGQSSIHFIPCSLHQDNIERAGMHAVFRRLIRQTSQHLGMKKHGGTFTITDPRLKLITVKPSSQRSPVQSQCHAQGLLNFQAAGARDQTFTSFTSLTQPLIPLSFRRPRIPQPMLKRNFFPNLEPCAVDSSWVERSHESRQEPVFGPQFILKGRSESFLVETVNSYVKPTVSCSIDHFALD